MLLRHSHTSPYVRKVVALLHETGLVDRVDIESVDGWSEPERLTDENPLSMVPTLVLDDGSSLYDSPVICEYLDGLHRGPRMIPEAGARRWQVLREQALADGVLDCAILVMMEQVKRPEALRWDWWLGIKQRAILRALDQLEREAPAWRDRVDLGVIAIASALGYLDLRGGVGAWREGRPALAAWFEAFAARPSMRASAPPA
ncbi:MAG: glutathione S-transferase N-terminal domain-containing protein [Gammaproteobacteria bacterium]|nr:glutathione S-transferase N-terminal domain-containing protein [Gammaproteobacteria bacterium]